MISTGPGREQTMLAPEFAQELTRTPTKSKIRVQARA
jgi:hypothetical protein